MFSLRSIFRSRSPRCRLRVDLSAQIVEREEDASVRENYLQHARRVSKRPMIRFWERSPLLFLLHSVLAEEGSTLNLAQCKGLKHAVRG